jgi:hypothetical protein
MHSGRDEESLRYARGLIERFEQTPVDAIIINSAGCGSQLKDYGRLFRNDPVWAERARAFSAKVKDVHEFLVALGPPRATRHPIAARVTYHDACHLAHGQRIRSQPRTLLRGIPGLVWWTFRMVSSAAAAPGPTTSSSRRARTRWGSARWPRCCAPGPSCWPRRTRGARCTSSGCSRPGRGPARGPPGRDPRRVHRGVGLPTGEPDHGKVPHGAPPPSSAASRSG